MDDHGQMLAARWGDDAYASAPSDTAYRNLFTGQHLTPDGQSSIPKSVRLLPLPFPSLTTEQALLGATQGGPGHIKLQPWIPLCVEFEDDPALYATMFTTFTDGLLAESALNCVNGARLEEQGGNPHALPPASDPWCQPLCPRKPTSPPRPSGDFQLLANNTLPSLLGVPGSTKPGRDSPRGGMSGSIPTTATGGWTKQGWTGVKVQGRAQGGAAWTDLGVDMFSPWADTRPLTTQNTPEVREYRMCHLDGDTPLMNWNDVVVVIVNP